MGRQPAVSAPGGFEEGEADESYAGVGGEGIAEVPPSHPLVPSLPRRASSQTQGHSCERIQSLVLEVAHVSLETSGRDNVSFAQPDFVPCRMLSCPSSLQKQLPGNTKYRFMIFVHFLVIVREETEALKQNRRAWSPSAPSLEASARQTFIAVIVPF